MLLIEFRDPLFSIIVFFTITFVITFFSYWYKHYKKRENSRSIEEFLEQFHTLDAHEDITTLIQTTFLPDKSWLLMAQVYVKEGDYEKSIEIYQTLLKKEQDNQSNKEILLLLGKTYFKAGFLERSRDIFLEILRTYPRTPQALKFLLIVYENLQQYQNALDVIEPMQAQKMKVNKDRDAIETIMISQQNDLSTIQKSHQLLEIYKREANSTHFIFSYLFKNASELAWQHLDLSKLEQISDILWNLEKEQCNFDIISKNSYLRELYAAKGYTDSATSSSIFEFNTLIKLNNCKSDNEATLNFEYLCTSCKEVSPFIFHRCPHCYEVDTMLCEYTLAQTHFESQYSF